MQSKVSCAQRIREGLLTRDMTQAELCRLTGIPKSAMSQYVNGGLVPRQDRTYLIAQALRVTEPWLMGFDVPMERDNIPTATKDDGLVGAQRELSDLIPQMTQEEAAVLVAAARAQLAARKALGEP